MSFVVPVSEGMYYFGEPWGEVAEHMPRGPSIPDAICDWCREPVLAGQSGLFVPASPFHEDSHEVVALRVLVRVLGRTLGAVPARSAS